MLTAFSFVYQPGSNIGSRWALIISLVDRHTLNIDPFKNWTADGSYYNNHFYSDKAVGSALLGAPVYFLISNAIPLARTPENYGWYRYLTQLFSLGLLFAGSVYLLVDLLVRMGSSESSALIAGALYGCATPATCYSSLFFGHGFACIFALAAFYFLYLAHSGKNEFRFILFAAISCALMWICEYTSGIAVGLFSLYLLLFDRKPNHIAWFIFIAWIFPISIHLGFNYLCFGNPFVTGYHTLRDQHYLQSMSQGLMGIGLPELSKLWLVTITPARGLFFLWPVIFISIPGMFYMIRSSIFRSEGILFALIALGYLLMNAGYFEPGGGACPGPRHLVPITGVLCISIGFVFSRTNIYFRALIIGLALISALTTCVIMLGAPMAPDMLANPLYEFHIPFFIQGSQDHIGYRIGISHLFIIALYWVVALTLFTIPKLKSKSFQNNARRFAFNKASITSFIGTLAVGSICYSLIFPRIAATEPGLVHQIKGNQFSMYTSHERAIEEYKAALNTRPDPYIYYYRGIQYQYMKQFLQARDDYSDFIQMVPDTQYKQALENYIKSVDSIRKKTVEQTQGENSP